MITSYDGATPASAVNGPGVMDTRRRVGLDDSPGASRPPVEDVLSEIVHVPFHGDDLLATKVDGKPFIVLKPAMEALGVSPASQAEKLKNKSWATTRLIEAVAEDGRIREMLAVDVRTLLMLLATIDENRVAEHVRPKLIAYQSEVADVIEAAFGVEEIDLPTALERYAATLRERDAAVRRAHAAGAVVEKLAPKAAEHDHYMDTGGLCSLAELGQQLGAGRNRLINRLRELGVLVSKGESQGGVRPMQRYVEQGWFKVKTKDTFVGVKAEAYATPKGVSKVYQLLVENGVGSQRWREFPVSVEELLRKITFEQGD